MTGTRKDPDLGGAQYSPIGHYSPRPDESTLHPENYRSRYWLRGPNQWESGTINAARKKSCYGVLELEEHSHLRLPHVYTQKLDRFEAFRGDNAQAMAYRLDESSYYRLMDRLGLHAGNYTPDVAPGAPPKQATPPTISCPSILPSNDSRDSSNQQYLSNDLFRPAHTKNGPSQDQRRSKSGRMNGQSPSS
ncbi:hypothetical protein sscle_08g064950 [Sclerotinia sclerotiorum 1980 UF-70]|nr:hypothetical protein sscle_08g064950 [Sclerotinia sclerotiorum 1980 UF-70]